MRAVTVGYDLRFRKKEPLPPAATELPLPPLFVGGTGRSGTTIVARILGADPGYHMIPFEVRFLTDRGGLCDLVEKRDGVQQVRLADAAPLERRRRRCGRAEARQRGAAAGGAGGAPGRASKTDRAGAAARFVHRLLDPVATAAGASGWIEMTPGNVRVAPVLARCWPASGSRTRSATGATSPAR